MSLRPVRRDGGRSVVRPHPSQVLGLAAGAATATTQALTWNAGDHATTDFKVEYKVHTDPTWSTFAHAASATPSITVTGLTTGTSYDYRVSAVNVYGTGQPSAVVTASTS
jgi:hypothetical protein